MAPVAVDGDAVRVQLVCAGAALTLPGDAPPGSYSIYATFADQVTMESGRMVVEAGQQYQVRCKSSLLLCNARATP